MNDQVERDLRSIRLDMKKRQTKKKKKEKKRGFRASMKKSEQRGRD